MACKYTYKGTEYSKEEITNLLSIDSGTSIKYPLGFVENKIVYINRESVKKDTLIHEFGHLWNLYSKQNFTETFIKGLEVIKNSEYHKAVQNNPAYAHLNAEGQLEEALAQAIGEKGVKILKESTKQKFDKWFKDLFKKIAEGLGIRSLSADKLADLTLDKYTDLVAAELLSGKQIAESTKDLGDAIDNTSIEFVIEQQEAIFEAKQKAKETLINKKALAKDVQKAIKDYINKNLNRKNISVIHKQQLQTLIDLVAKTDNVPKLRDAKIKVDEITKKLDAKEYSTHIDKLKARELAKQKAIDEKSNIKLKRKSLEDYLEKVLDKKHISNITLKEIQTLTSLIASTITSNGFTQAITKIDALAVRLDTRYNETKDRIEEKRRLIKEKLENQKSDNNEIAELIRNYINDSFDNKLLGKDFGKREFKKLINKTKRPASGNLTRKKLIKVINEVDTIVLELQNKGLVRDINAIYNTNFSKKESGRRKGNITTEEAETVVNNIKKLVNNLDDVKITPPTADNKRGRQETKVIELIDKKLLLENKLEDQGLTNKEELELTEITIAIDLLNADLTTDVAYRNTLLSESKESMKSIVDKGRDEIKALRELRKQEDANFISEIEEDVNPEGKDGGGLSLKELESLNKGFLIASKRAFFTFFQGKVSGSLDSVSVLISKKGGDDRDSSPLVQFVNKMKSRETLKIARIKKFAKIINDHQINLFGSVRKAHAILDKKVDITVFRHFKNDTTSPRMAIPVTYTQSQLLNIWMNAHNTDLLGGLDANGYTAEVLEQIEQILPENVKEYGNKLFEVYEKSYIDSNKTYKDMNFHSLGKNEFYAGKLYRSDASYKDDQNALLGGKVNIGSTGYGSQKERVVNNNPIQAVDVNFLINQNIQESSHYVAFAEVHRQYTKLLKNEGFRKAIHINNKGTGDMILRTLNYYKTRDLEQGGESGFPLIDFFGRNIARSVLALKTKIGITQAISILNGSFDMPSDISTLETMSYYNPVEIVSTFRYLLSNSDYLVNRYDVGGIEKAITGLSDLASQSALSFDDSGLEASRKSAMRFYKKALDLGMLNVKLGDAIAVMGSVPMYNAWFNKFLKEGDSESVARTKAIAKFEASVDRSQQSFSSFGKSELQKHPVARYFMMFTTSPIQNQQNANFHRRELMRGILKGNEHAKGSSLKNGLAFLNYQVAQPMLYTYFAQIFAGSLTAALGFGDDEPDDSDRDLLAALILGNVTSIPMMGAISKILVEQAIGKDFSFGSIVDSALLDSTDKLAESWMKAYKSKTESSRVKHTRIALKNTAGILLGLPNFAFDKTYDAIDGIYWNDEIDNEVLFLKGFGYSDYVIEQARKERVSKESSKEVKEKIEKKYQKSIETYKKGKGKIEPIFKKDGNKR